MGIVRDARQPYCEMMREPAGATHELVSVEVSRSQNSVHLDIELDVGSPGRNGPYMILRALDTKFPDRLMRTLEFTGRAADRTPKTSHQEWQAQA